MGEDKFGDIRQVKRVHLIGIGGAGLSAVATVLLEQGYQVSGSDLHPSSNTRRLQEKGAQVYIGHAAEQLGEAQMVIVSWDWEQMPGLAEVRTSWWRRMNMTTPFWASDPGWQW